MANVQGGEVRQAQTNRLTPPLGLESAIRRGSTRSKSTAQLERLQAIGGAVDCYDWSAGLVPSGNAVDQHADVGVSGGDRPTGGFV
jgi:hypothetical protein